MTALFRVEIRKCSIPKHLSALATLDTLPRSTTKKSNQREAGGNLKRTEPDQRTFASASV